MLFLTLTLVNYYFYIYCGSDVRINDHPQQTRRNYKPEFLTLILFTALSFTKNSEGHTLIRGILGFVGFTTIIVKTFGSGSYFTPKVKFLHGAGYITSFWFFMSYYLSASLQQYNSRIGHPLVIFLVVYICIMITFFLLRPKVTIYPLDASKYGAQQEEAYLEDLEKVVYAYKKCAHSEDTTYLKTIMTYVSNYQTRMLENYKSDPLCFTMLTGGLTYISPENYHTNLLKGFLEHILHKYREGIVAYPKSIELRISLSYVLNDLALLKNEALTTAHYCKDLNFTLSQGVKIKTLLKYLEEEEIYHERGLGSKMEEGSHKVSITKQDSAADNIFITSKQIDVKTYQKRMTQKRKFFVMRVMRVYPSTRISGKS